jgi:mannosyltransferase OCH1-like enzyme
VNIIPYTKDAYEAKKYAFVSDYARFWILYKYGGLYFDTDVEVIKPMDDIIERGPFMGVEVPANNAGTPKVAPGLGLGVSPGLGLYKNLLDLYATLHFVNNDGSLNQKTIVSYTTEILQREGLQPTNEIQEIAGIWIYPADYFNPFNDLTGKLDITANTRSIHWYSKTWNNQNPIRQWLSRMSHRVFGMCLHNFMENIKKFLNK